MNDVRLAWDFGKTSILVFFWIAWHFVYWYAFAYSEFPNQIHWVYSFGMLGLACLLFPGQSPFAFLLYRKLRSIPGLAELLLLIALYFGAYYVVSFWELFPGTTVAWGKFEIVNVIIAITLYIFGRTCGGQEIVRAHYVLAAIVVAVTIVQIAVDREAIRFGYGWQLMLCLPAAVLLRRYWFVLLGLTVMLASQHKAALGSAIVAVAIAFLLSRFPKERLSPARVYVKIALWIVASLIFVAAGLVLYEQIEVTIERFAEIDQLRERVAEVSLSLLSEYFPAGMGYMNFAEFTGLHTDLASATTRLGYEPVGTSLHNVYLSWSLEGGILVTSVVLLLFARIAKRVRWTLKNNRNLGALMLAWCAALLLLGAFHQVHQMMQFWGTIGLIFGYYDQLLRVRSRYSAPQRVVQPSQLLAA